MSLKSCCPSLSDTSISVQMVLMLNSLPLLKTTILMFGGIDKFLVDKLGLSPSQKLRCPESRRSATSNWY